MITRILEDKAQKQGEHIFKNHYWQQMGIEVIRVPLPVGDYIGCNEYTDDVIERKAKRGTDLKKMDFLGTYKVSVDTKKDMQEIVGNICGKSHERFRDECILAKNNGIKLYVLVENTDGIRDIKDVFKWQNPRNSYYNKVKYMQSIGKWLDKKVPKLPPTNGQTLAKAMLTMQLKYGVEFVFCKPNEAGSMVIKLLES